ncbi:MAG: DUF2336 domain-containing protein [Caulobacterales bacterium]
MSKLHDLIALAREPTSEKRRELLREVTDLFFVALGAPPLTDLALFDDVLTQIAGEMETAVRAELAERMAPAAIAPRRLLRGLATDAIEVARPVLEQSAALNDDDLLFVAANHGQDHLKAISSREAVSEQLADAIVERADDHTLGVLLRNDGAELSRQAHETAVDRANDNPDLHEDVVGRHALPIDLLNELYFVVEGQLRAKILERNARIDPDTLEAALASGRRRVATQDGALPPDYELCEREIQAMAKRKALTPPVLAGMLRSRETVKFMIALAELSDIDFHTARRILDRRELDALAIVCKAAGFDRSLFLTFAVLILDREANAMGRAKEYGELYAELPRESAQRTLRFWRMRRVTNDKAA